MDPVTIAALATALLRTMEAVEGLSRTTGRTIHPDFLEAQNELRRLAVERAREAYGPEVTDEATDDQEREDAGFGPDEIV